MPPVLNGSGGSAGALFNDHQDYIILRQYHSWNQALAEMKFAAKLGLVARCCCWHSESFRGDTLGVPCEHRRHICLLYSLGSPLSHFIGLRNDLLRAQLRMLDQMLELACWHLADATSIVYTVSVSRMELWGQLYLLLPSRLRRQQVASSACHAVSLLSLRLNEEVEYSSSIRKLPQPLRQNMMGDMWYVFHGCCRIAGSRC
jgi:hypothetical protein